VVADVRDPPGAMPVDDGLIRASGLQVVVTDQLHVALFSLSWLSLLRWRSSVEPYAQRREAGRHSPKVQVPHGSTFREQNLVSWLDLP
jgi:hypothetical protein